MFIDRQRLSKYISAYTVTSHSHRGAVFSVRGPCRMFIGDNGRSFVVVEATRHWEFKDENAACPLWIVKSSWVQIRTEEYEVTKDKKTSYSFEVLVSVLRSVARRRLAETENPSACATMKWKFCKSAIALYCLYLKDVVNKSNHPN
jgi:hypothetical protein